VGGKSTGWVFSDASGDPIHPHSISQTFERIVTVDTYQHVLPGMQAEAARVFEQLIAPAAPTGIGR